QTSPSCAPRDPRRTARRCSRNIEVPSTPTPRPAIANGRHSASPDTVNAKTVATSQPTVIARITGHGLSSAGGRAGGCGGIDEDLTHYGHFLQSCYVPFAS